MKGGFGHDTETPCTGCDPSSVTVNTRTPLVSEDPGTISSPVAVTSSEDPPLLKLVKKPVANA
jgi:hypothetical protein